VAISLFSGGVIRSMMTATTASAAAQVA